MLDSRLKMLGEKQLRRNCAPSTSAIFNRTSHIPRSALTLIELLIVIVILTTLVAGVIPVLSPNNDERKIRTAARGLQSYITLTQARAARTGRPQGIAFRESSPESGVALEVFGLQVPPPFAGFSSESRATVTLKTTAPFNYSAGNFLQFDNFPLYWLDFVLADGVPSPDVLPPRSFRIGDEISVDGNLFLIVDTNDNDSRTETVGTAPNQISYISPTATPINRVDCVWINNSGQMAPRGLKHYRINRQPTNSSESPYQLPAGIAIDMQASVVEGPPTGGFPTGGSLFEAGRADSNTVGIMFSPTGAVDRLLFNGNEITNASRIVLLLGRIENGGLTGTEWSMLAGDSNDELEQKQEEINWLNLDSRLLSIATRSGRAIVSETAFVDPRTLADPTSAEDQMEAAHEFAHEMTTSR